MSDKFKVQDDLGFFAETDDDDRAFLSHPTHGTGGYSLYDNNRQYGADRMQDPAATDAERRQQQLMAEIDRIQQRTVESSKRSLRLVAESEQVGVATAEELMAQRERLENCETKVGEMDRSLRVSQKHLNSIKSLFGGFKNMFSKTPAEGATLPATGVASADEQPRKTTSYGSGQLAQAVQEVQSKPSAYRPPAHPGMRLRGLDEEEEDVESSRMAAQRAEMSSRARFKAAENQLDENLDDLSSGLARLKGLALGLGDEIQDQNSMLDRLTDAVEHTDIGINRQNKQMHTILKK